MAALAYGGRRLAIQEGDRVIGRGVVVALMAADTLRGIRIFGLPLRQEYVEVIVHIARSGNIAVALQTILIADRGVERGGLRRMPANP